MNKAQKVIKAIIYPLIIVIVTIGIAGDIARWWGGWRSVSAFDFERTWFVWVLALVIIYKIENGDTGEVIQGTSDRVKNN
jgi:hypothetical protein